MSNYSWLVGGLLVGAILTGFYNLPSLPSSRRTLLVALTTLLCVWVGLGEIYLVSVLKLLD